MKEEDEYVRELDEDQEMKFDAKPFEQKTL